MSQFKKIHDLKRYYTIGDIAGMVDTNTSHLRYLEKDQFIPYIKRNRHGRRVYNQDQAHTIMAIIYLTRQLGWFTLTGAVEYLNS